MGREMAHGETYGVEAADSIEQKSVIDTTTLNFCIG